MDRTRQEQWRREALDLVFAALAASKSLCNELVFKGARVLSLRLGEAHRVSYDLDANLLDAFVARHPDRTKQAETLHCLLEQSITEYCESQDPMRYRLEGITINNSPPQEHPLGWEGFKIRIRLRDFANEGVRGLSPVEFDVAAPEQLGDHSISPLAVGGGTVFAYTLERIAGEKMRAFLSSLPAYRDKMGKPGTSIRAKDIFDVAIIALSHPLTDTTFWETAGEEFRLACRSRYVDCCGVASFAERLDTTRAAYELDPTIPAELNFVSAWSRIESILEFWERQGLTPFQYPLTR